MDNAIPLNKQKKHLIVIDAIDSTQATVSLGSGLT